jgi:DNA invertase Pin-like site-specific DNA recombinase
MGCLASVRLWRRCEAQWYGKLLGESAFSGSAGYRAAIETLLWDARMGVFDVLACWSLDRLTRQGPLDALRLLDRLG